MRTHHLLALTASITVAALALTATSAPGGPLDPPAGPVAPTAKPIAELEPRTAINAANTPGNAAALFRITQPGSYYLTGNITGVAGKSGIEITTSGVTVDLRGFNLTGVAGSLDGIVVPGLDGTNTIAITSGLISSWGGAGINTSNKFNIRITSVTASNNHNDGIYAGKASTIIGCNACSNGGNGISTDEGCTVTASACSYNGGSGFAVGKGSTVSACAAIQNGGAGLGISTSTGGPSSFVNCSASNNRDGIAPGAGSTVTDCTVVSNTRHGILANSACTITNCTITSNASNGIDASAGCMIVGCTLRSNGLNGISAGASGAIIRDNTCSSNGANGTAAGINIVSTPLINLMGPGARIEGNNCYGATYGILVASSGNIIIKNTCKATQYNFQIAAGNAMGPIVNATTNAALIEGGAGGAPSTLSTDPNANYNF
jgi:parallel beta-helix repeat protein